MEVFEESTLNVYFLWFIFVFPLIYAYGFIAEQYYITLMSRENAPFMNYERTLLILSLSIKCDIIKQMYYWDQNFYWSFLHTKRRWGSMQAPWPYYYDARIKRPRKHVSFYSWFYEMILWSEQAFWVRDGWNEYSFFTYDIGYFIKKIKLEIFKNFRYCTNFVYIYVYYAYIYLCVCVRTYTPP